MTSRIRLGVIGAGAHASENLLPAARVSGDVDIVAVCTRSTATADAAARRWQIPRATTTLDEVCDIAEALLASGPPDLHEAVIAAAINRGLPLFVEKPPARSAARLGALLPAAGVADLPVFVDFNMRYSTAWQIVCSVLPVEEVRFMRIRLVARKPREPIWGMTSVVRSLLLSVGIHALDLAITVLGTSVLCALDVAELGGGRVSISATVRGSGGVTAVVEVGNYASAFESQIDMVGDVRRTVIDNLTRISTTFVGHRLSEKAAECVELGGLSGGFERNGYGPALGHFAGIVRGVARSGSDLSHSAEVLALLDEICDRAEAFEDRS